MYRELLTPVGQEYEDNLDKIQLTNKYYTVNLMSCQTQNLPS